VTPNPKRNPGFLPRSRAQVLIDALLALGYSVLGPSPCDGAVGLTEVRCIDQLTPGLRESQQPGRYRLESAGDGRWFGWTVGPQGLKPLLFPPREVLWRSVRDGGGLRFEAPEPAATAFAVIGVRACDLAALALLDAHFLGGPAPDPGYAARRRGLFLVGVDCARAAPTCFCVSTGDGPMLTGGYDIGLSELDEGLLVWPGTDAGRAIVDRLPLERALPDLLAEAAEAGNRAAATQRRRLPSRHLARALFLKLDHARWRQAGARCLACGNCTAVCPTCFCYGTGTEPALADASAAQVRRWDSCFSAEHSLLHGRPLRPDPATRYRQWLTHKLGGWHTQYGRSGCVGCGRCITWCPAGIDLVAEVGAIAGGDGDD
jgi:sulfhydrogenase subunit beta (sulfur reductase)